MGRGRGRGDSSAGRGRRGGTSERGANRGGDGSTLTAGQVGLDVHAVAESTRITLDRQLHAFRDDEDAKSLAFPPALDNTSRKFIHEAVKRLGLESKSRGKGDARFITVTKKKSDGAGGGDRSELPPVLRLGQWRSDALDAYFSRRPSNAREVDAIMSAAIGGGMHSAAELVTQKRHKAKLQEQQTRAMMSEGASAEELRQREISYRAAQKKRLSAASYRRMSSFREGLPAWEYRDTIVGMVKDNQASMVSGETGCGKSTQVPQFLLDDPAIGPGCKIVCTQPRRISAIAVAERIADERGESIGGKVGYTIRLESSVSKDTQLILMTPGILLKKLARDPLLKEYTHVLIDEVHERDRNSEFLLIVLRGLLTKRPDLRLVLMSATLQQGKYSGYFGGCPITTIGARTFPVQAFFLEDVLVQTKYLEEIGLDGASASGSGRSRGLLGGTGFNGLGGNGEDDAYTCAMCGKAGFRSAEELGTHAAMCFGTEGLDPVLEGFLDDVLNFPSTEMREEAPKDAPPPPPAATNIPSHWNGEASASQGFDMNGDVARSDSGLGADDEESTMAELRSRPPDVHIEGGSQPIANGRGGDVGARVNGDLSDIGEGISGDGNGRENNLAAHTVQDNEDGEDREADNDDDDDLDSEGFNDAVALSQRWDGKGTFRAERASATSGKAEDLLTKYQFAFDDESVDYELVECLLRYICRSAYEDGAVLVFLPGWDDISRLGDFLRQSSHFSDEQKFQILPLHSGVPTAKQRQVFAKPPAGCRKIVLSTNIAETSITIDDVSFVIDSGRAKESNYDPHLAIKTLVPQWVSKASARQRRGRAGRTKAGVCFHLFSARRHDSLRDHQESELLRTPLEEVVLQAKMLGLANGGPGEIDSAAGFLSQAIDAPPELSLRNAVQLLQSLGALDDEEELTDLGVRLAGISIDPRVGKMVLWSYLLGCAGPALTAACAMTYKDPFVLPMNAAQRKEAKSAKIALAQGSESDLIALLRALEGHADAKARGGMGAASSLARRGHLSAPTLGMIWDICGQVARELKGMGLPSTYDWGNPCNSNSRDVSLLSSVLCAGLYPNVAMRRSGRTNFTTMGGHTARLHMSSINAARSQRLAQPNAGKQMEFIAFGEMTRTSANFVMSNTTPVSPLALLLLCGNLKAEELFGEEEEEDEDDEELYDDQELAARAGTGAARGPTELLLELDKWVQFRLPLEQGRRVLVLRNRLQAAFAQHMQTNGRPPAGPATDAIAATNALLHEPSVATGAATSGRGNGGFNRYRGGSSSGTSNGRGGRGNASGWGGSAGGGTRRRGEGRGGGVSQQAGRGREGGGRGDVGRTSGRGQGRRGGARGRGSRGRN